MINVLQYYNLKWVTPVVVLITVISLFSCGKSSADPAPVVTNSRVDTLFGKWRHSTSTFFAADGLSAPFVVVNSGLADTLHFGEDMKGSDQLNASYLVPHYNFSYQLLADDSTIVFNHNPTGTPVYDTGIILRLTPTELIYKTPSRYYPFPAPGGRYSKVTWNCTRY